jgi:hypothetical protein
MFMLIGLIAAVSIAAAQSNSLTPKEIGDGWILLFDGETNFGWRPRGEARWEVRDGVIAASSGGAGMLSTTTEFADFVLKAEVWIDDQANSGIFLRCPTMGDITQNNAYEVNVYDAHATWPTGSINGVAKTKVKVSSIGKWTPFEILAQGDRLVVNVDGKQTVDARDAKYGRGNVALQYNGKGTVRFRDVQLKPLSLESIFNGKDLTGWKEIPNRKSVYTVTPEGFLNVKNGNGDLQTERTWGDFALQLDIISNGNRLNSGVFFRGDAGQFWSGYESQIRNQWQGEDRTKPVDFGTGGIYGQQPARKVVPNDREWFTKTVVAHGNHFAVWVNGYQVSDFFDNRPPNDNARNGYRSKPGIISLQGHDPTTDLSFRNVRVKEMPTPRG